MDRIAQNKKVLAMANTISKAIEAETEEVLEHAEAVVRKYIPARYVKAALTKIEQMLNKEGVEAMFEKTITREALRKTASVKVDARELHETIAAIVNAIVAETEDTLKDAESVANDAVNKFAASERFEVESKLKSVMEKKMASKGIYCKFARKAKPINRVAARIAKSK